MHGRLQNMLLVIFDIRFGCLVEDSLAYSVLQYGDEKIKMSSLFRILLHVQSLTFEE